MADNTTLNAGSGGDTVAMDDIGGVKYQRVKVNFGADGSATDVDSTHGLPVSLNAAAFIFSTNNSTTSQLAAGATFTGVIEAVLDQPSLSLLLTSDQPVTITVYPLIDSGGTFAGQPIVYYALANQGFSTSVPLNCNYVKVTVKNTGTATTTTLNLSTAYGNLPSSDTQGRVPISQADCVPLLTATITATGSSASMDTLGYGAVVAQLTGVWQGFCYFEASNNGSDWDTVLTFSRDSLSLQDIVTQGGMYTIRPSGRYLRLTVTNITGSMVITAIGRAAEGIAASDLLSLAMDPVNGTPMQTQVQGSAGMAIAQDPVSRGAVVLPAVRNFQGTLSATTGVSSVVGPFACADMQSLSFNVYYPSGSAAIIVVEIFAAGFWQAIPCYSFSGGSAASGQNIAISAVAASPVEAKLFGATQVRIRATTISGNMYVTGQLSSNNQTLTSLVTAGQFGSAWNISTLGTVAIGASLATGGLSTSGALPVAAFSGAWASAIDAASSARTTSGNSGTITDSLGGALGAVIVVSAVSGTTPTLDIVLQESLDGGTTWDDVWHCERLTAAGTLRVPSLPINGRRRWTWTISGTTPSFTFAIAPTRGGTHPYPILKQFFERSLDLSTNGAVGSLIMKTAGCDQASAYLLAASNAGTTTTLNLVGAPDTTEILSSTQSQMQLLHVNLATTGGSRVANQFQSFSKWRVLTSGGGGTPLSYLCTTFKG